MSRELKTNGRPTDCLPCFAAFCHAVFVCFIYFVVSPHVFLSHVPLLHDRIRVPSAALFGTGAGKWLSHTSRPHQRCNTGRYPERFLSGCRVALGGCPPRAPTDPDVPALEHPVPQVTPSLRHNLASRRDKPVLYYPSPLR